MPGKHCEYGHRTTERLGAFNMGQSTFNLFWLAFRGGIEGIHSNQTDVAASRSFLLAVKTLLLLPSLLPLQLPTLSPSLSSSLSPSRRQ